MSGWTPLMRTLHGEECSLLTLRALLAQMVSLPLLPENRNVSLLPPISADSLMSVPGVERVPLSDNSSQIDYAS